VCERLGIDDSSDPRVPRVIPEFLALVVSFLAAVAITVVVLLFLVGGLGGG
jgi:hypothetical protein